MIKIAVTKQTTCKHTWLSSGSEKSGIAERGLLGYESPDVPPGAEVTWERSGTDVVRFSLNDWVGRRPDTPENK